VTDRGVDSDKTESRTSYSLLERVRARDQAAWERLVTLYGPMVYGWCRRAGLQPADAADIGQEVFAAVARSIETFRHGRPGDTFRGWLFTITRNKLRDRSAPPGSTGAGGSDALERLAKVPDAVPGAADSPFETAVVDETRSLHRRAVDLVRGEFEARTWTAFWQVCVEGRAPADVAADLGVTVNAVYLAKSRILRRLHDEFAALIDFDAPGAPGAP
jgi:RNA polymerase sigma-70 factor (ECF subfamily)